MDFGKDSKRDVAEIKFLIHDLRVEKFINDIMHFHVTLNTDLEIYNIEQAQALHNEDLQELRTLAYDTRKALQDYSNAVRSFSPDQSIINTGMTYIEKIQEICELVLNPLWGRFDKVISFLPVESRSVRSRSHYRNNVGWICGVYYRIEYFLQETENQQLYEEYDVAEDTYDFTNNVVFGYVTEKSASKVDILFDKECSAVIGGNKARFRRMYFNMVMNAVDAMQDKAVGVLKVRIYKDQKYVNIEVEDNGAGMSPDKIKSLLSEKNNLDGELHSLGFVFVQQTIQEFDGTIAIKSQVNKGTKITIAIPFIPGKIPPKVIKSKCEKYLVVKLTNTANKEKLTILDRETVNYLPGGYDPPTRPFPGPPRKTQDENGEPRESDQNEFCGKIIHNDYKTSQAQYPGCVFAIAVNYELKLDFFTHKPYEKFWNISHEDLSPMYFEATVRGRLEENKAKQPELILKTPHSVKEFFDLKELPEEKRNSDQFIQMMHDEYILIARKLTATGMPNNINVHATNIRKYFKNYTVFFDLEPFLISLLADQPLSTELDGQSPTQLTTD